MPSSWNCTASWRSCWLSALLATSSTGGAALGIQDEQHGVGLLDRLLGLGAHERKVVGRSLGQGLLRRQALRLDAAGIPHGALPPPPAGRSPARRLNRVDLPTLGRPTSATIGFGMPDSGGGGGRRGCADGNFDHRGGDGLLFLDGGGN